MESDRFIAFESYEQVIGAARASRERRLNEYLAENGLLRGHQRRGAQQDYSTAPILSYTRPEPDFVPGPYSIPEVSVDGGIVRRGRTPIDDDEPMQFCGVCVPR